MCPTVTIQTNLSKNLIPFYGATMSLRDRLMFQIFRIEDFWSEGTDIHQIFAAWKPIIGSKTANTKTLDFVTLLDAAKVEATSSWVLTRHDKSESLSSLPLYYDPGFLLALQLYVIENEEHISISTWHSITRSGLVGLTMCALSSDHKAWRFLADRCLTKCYQKLKSLDHPDASEILLPIEHFRNLHVSSDENGKVTCVPPLITLFLSRCLKVFCSTPESVLHQPLSRFLLQRAVIDGKDVPMLYSLLYSSADMPSESHLWLVHMLRDGLCRTIDYRIMNHRQTFEILTTLVLSASHRSAPKLRHSFLQLLKKATSHNQSCIKLVSKSGLLKVLRQFKPSINESKEIIHILREVVCRIPLLHPQIAREIAENTLELLQDLNEAEDRRSGSVVINSLAIIRSLLTCHSFWISKGQHDRILAHQVEFGQTFSLDSIHRFVRKLARWVQDDPNPHRGRNQRLLKEIDARLGYISPL